MGNNIISSEEQPSSSNNNNPQNQQQCTNKQTHNHTHTHKPIQTFSNSLNPQQKFMKDSILLPQFGGQVSVDKVNKLFIKKIQLLQFQISTVQKIIKKRLLLKHPNFITVKNYSFQSLKDNQQFDTRTDLLKKIYICYPQSKILRLQFQPAVLNVHGLIKSYCQKRQPMQQSQIIRIMRCVVECLIYLRQNGTYHGDIKPATIFIHPKTNQVKLVDSFLLNNGKTSYEIVNQNPKSQSFLTPQQLQKKKNKQSDSLQNIYQSQIFCIGLTLIEMMTFQSSMQAYDLQKLQIKRQFLQRKLVEMKQYQYSYQLADLSLRCIHKDPAKRPSFQEILAKLN